MPLALALIVQVPAATNVVVIPETVQMLGVVEVKETVRLESAVAESVSGAPTVCVPGLLNVMVCVVLPMTVPLPQPVASRASDGSKRRKSRWMCLT